MEPFARLTQKILFLLLQTRHQNHQKNSFFGIKNVLAKGGKVHANQKLEARNRNSSPEGIDYLQGESLQRGNGRTHLRQSTDVGDLEALSQRKRL